MQNIQVKRYSNSEEIGWQGWIEPDDLSWIIFVDNEGKVQLYDKRDPKTGAVL